MEHVEARKATVESHWNLNVEMALVLHPSLADLQRKLTSHGLSCRSLNPASAQSKKAGEI